MVSAGSELTQERRRSQVLAQPAFGLAGAAALFTAIYVGLFRPHPYWQTLVVAIGGFAMSYALAAVSNRLRERRAIRRRET